MASILLLSMLAQYPIATWATPAEPMITPRALLPRASDAASASDDPSASTDFFAWYSDSDANTFKAVMCGDGSTFYSSASLAGCCSVGSEHCEDEIFTTCSGTVAMYAGGRSSCMTSCNSDFVYTASTADAFPLYWVGCNEEAQRMYFRVEPEITGSSSLNGPTASSGSTGSSIPRSTATESKPSATASSTGEALTSTPKKDSNVPVIVGSVVGALAVIGIAAGLLLFLLRRRKRTKGAVYKPAPGVDTLHPQPYQSTSTAAFYDPHNQKTPSSETTQYKSQAYPAYGPPPVFAAHAPLSQSPSPNPPQATPPYQQGPVVASYAPPSVPPSPNPPQATPYQEYKGNFAPGLPAQDEKWKHEANGNSLYPQSVSPPPRTAASPHALETALPGTNIGELSANNPIAELPGLELSPALQLPATHGTDVSAELPAAEVHAVQTHSTSMY